MYYLDPNDYKWFENRVLTRILFTSILCILTSNRLGSNSFKRTTQRMMYCTLFGQILSYLLLLFERSYDIVQGESAKYHVIAYKLLVDLVFMTFNCSVCYAMAMYLQLNQITLLRIWYAAIGLIVTFLIFHTFLMQIFGRLNHLMNGLICVYSLKLLYQIKNKHQKSFDADVPSFVLRLIQLEFSTMLLCFVVYPISVFKEHVINKGQHDDIMLFKYDLLLYIMEQCRTTITILYLLKMYTFIIEWGGSGSRSQKIHDEMETLVATKV